LKISIPVVFPEGEFLETICEMELFINSLFISWVNVEVTFHSGIAVYLGVSSTPVALGSVLIEKVFIVHYYYNIFFV
jgi:hypothetical protein